MIKTASLVSRGFVRQGHGMSAVAGSQALRCFHMSAPVMEPELTVQQQQVLIANHLHKNNPHLLGSLTVRHPATPFILGYGDVEDEMSTVDEAVSFDMEDDDVETWDLMNRNARRPKKANHGARPCSRVNRRKRKRRAGNWRR